MLASPLYYTVMESPIGRLRLVASDKGLRAVFPHEKYAAPDTSHIENPQQRILLKTEKQLAEYFDRKRKDFDLPLELRGTVFQINAWRQLQQIPYGQTISYGEQATRMGDAKKARAVGMANGRNPIFIIVPCHRVIGASGGLTGYGGGLPMKQQLLELEQ